MVHSPEQRDRNLTVLIPRAKYRPVSSQQSSTLLTMSTFGPEQKLLNYAASRESSRTPEKKVQYNLMIFFLVVLRASCISKLNS